MPTTPNNLLISRPARRIKVEPQLNADAESIIGKVNRTNE
jgi:hypothetical protein